MHESLRLVQNAEPTFGIQFYQRLFSRHPEVEEHFRNTSMQQQATILTIQLLVVEAFYSFGSRSAKNYLHLLGTRHSDRGIPADAYPLFRDTLIESLKHLHGDAWTEHLEVEWNSAIDLSIEAMLEGYRVRFHV